MKNKYLFGVPVSIIILAIFLTAVPTAHAGTYTMDTIELDPGVVNGIGAEDIVVNPVTNRIYTANKVSDLVSVIDGSTDEFIKNIAVGNGPVSVDVNTATNKIYVVNEDDSTVTVIDGSTDTVEATIGVGNPAGTYGPTGMEINRTTKRAYVANMDDGDVYVIDGDPVSPNFNTVIATISPGFMGWGVLFVAVNEATNTVYILKAGGGFES